MSEANAEGDETDEYEPAVVTAGEDHKIELAFRDERIDETEHVTMPDEDETNQT
jgi:hypothetical protein